MPCGTFNIVNMGGRVRDVAPPQMCQSQSHHVTLGMTIERSPRGEGPDRPRERERAETRRERRTGRALDPRQLQSWWEEGATPQGHSKGDGPVMGPDRGEWDTRLKGRSVHTQRLMIQATT